MSDPTAELIERVVTRGTERADDAFLEEMEGLLRRGITEEQITYWLVGRWTYFSDVWRDYLEIKHAPDARVSDPPGTVAP